MLQLLEQMTTLLRHSLTPYTSVLIPKLAAVIASDTTSQRVPSHAAIAGDAPTNLPPSLPPTSLSSLASSLSWSVHSSLPASLPSSHPPCLLSQDYPTLCRPPSITLHHSSSAWTFSVSIPHFVLPPLDSPLPSPHPFLSHPAILPTALEGFGSSLEAYSCLFLPEIVRLLSESELSSRNQLSTLRALQRLSTWVSLLRVMNQLVPVLLRVVREGREARGEVTGEEEEQQAVVLQLLITLACQAGHTRMTIILLY